MRRFESCHPNVSCKDQPLLFAGSSHPKLVAEMGLELGCIELGKFPDGETHVCIGESVRGRDVCFVQSLARRPNEYLMELLAMVDAARRASAAEVTAVIPYFAYARQDRLDGRVPVTARLVANMLEVAGVDRVVTVDLHAGQIQGFFNIPVDNLSGRKALLEGLEHRDLVVVAPDVGSIKIAKAYAKDLGVEFATIDKQRITHEKVEVTTVIGDIKGRDVLLADDIISTGSTLEAAAEACQAAGAKRIFAAVTHGLLVGNAVDRVEKSPIEALFVTDTVPGIVVQRKIKLRSVAKLFGNYLKETQGWN